MRKKQKAILTRFSEAIRSNLSKMQRLKINGLVVIEVHQRDIIDKLYKSGCKDTGAFEWLAQLRFYWEKVRSLTHLLTPRFLNVSKSL